MGHRAERAPRCASPSPHRPRRLRQTCEGGADRRDLGPDPARVEPRRRVRHHQGVHRLHRGGPSRDRIPAASWRRALPSRVGAALAHAGRPAMMALTSRTRRLLRRASLLAVAISIGISSGAWGTPCDPTIFQPVPDCQVQTQTPVRYDGWDTSYWAFYCGGDHPYFWGMSSGWILNFTWDNSCFSAIENVFGETEANKFSVLFTNWCITHQYVTVSL